MIKTEGYLWLGRDALGISGLSLQSVDAGLFGRKRVVAARRKSSPTSS